MLFDLKKDWVCTIEHKAGQPTVTVVFTAGGPHATGTATASISLTVASIQDASGVQRGIVLDK